MAQDRVSEFAALSSHELLEQSLKVMDIELSEKYEELIRLSRHNYNHYRPKILAFKQILEGCENERNVYKKDMESFETRKRLENECELLDWKKKWLEIEDMEIQIDKLGENIQKRQENLSQGEGKVDKIREEQKATHEKFEHIKRIFNNVNNEKKLIEKDMTDMKEEIKLIGQDIQDQETRFKLI